MSVVSQWVVYLFVVRNQVQSDNSVSFYYYGILQNNFTYNNFAVTGTIRNAKNSNIMEKSAIGQKAYEVVAEAFANYHDLLLAYVYKRIHDWNDSEDVVQDVFLRLLELGDMVCTQTVRGLVFTTAQNLLVDRLRRRVRKADVYADLYERQPAVTDSTEQQIHAHSLMWAEQGHLKALPPVCRKIYYMSRFREMSVDEVSQELCINRRTVETQLFRGRKKMRTYLKAVGGF